MGTLLKDKRILLTGGTTGIGRATLALLASEGANVLTFGRHDPELQDSLSHARPEAGGRIVGMVADIATREGEAEVFSAVDRELGGLDILINNAGVSGDGIMDEDDESWRYAVATDFTACLACARAAITRMRDGGHIVFIGSISAGKKAAGSSVYAASKAGVRVFAETLRKEVAEAGIKVTWIEPGSVGADMQASSPEEQRRRIAENKMLYAEELADTIRFVLTRSARTDISAMRVEPLLQWSKKPG